jgi:hypothetical protein
MVGGATYPPGRRTRYGAAREGSEMGWVEELEGLRKALTDDEFESAKRHLLAG